MDVKNKNRIGYKKTKVGWIPNTWITQKLKECCLKIGSGITPKGGESTYLNAGVALVRSQNVLNEAFCTDGLRYISNAQHEKMKTSALRPRDILFNITGASIGRCCIFPSSVGEANVNQHVCIIRLTTSFCPEFVASVLNSCITRKQLHENQAGGGREGLNFQNLGAFRIPLPPLLEQEAIAGVLECWDQAIRNYEKKIEKKRNIKKGLMQRLLSGKQRLPGFSGEWKEVRLGDVCEIIMGQSPASSFYNKTQEGLPLLQGNNDIKNGFSCPHYWTSQITRFCLPGDILMTVRAPVGEIALSIHKACIGRGICAIRGKTASQRFVFYSLDNSENAWKAFGQGSTFTAINSKDVRDFQIAVPSEVKEQEVIADLLSNANDEIAFFEQKLSLLRDQKRFLLNDLVTGTIRLPQFRGGMANTSANGDQA